MDELLKDAFKPDVDITLSLLLIRLSAAFALGCVVGAVYRLTRRPTAADLPSLTPTLILLTILIAMVTLAIGNSVARAFSLVGALAIVRFRTVVEDTRDTAFVIFAVAVGMAVGAGFLTVPLVGIPFAALAAFLFRPRAAATPAVPLDYTLTVRVGIGHDPATLLREPFDKYLARAQLTAVATARQGVSLELAYAVRLRDELAAVTLVNDLNGIEGVQGVELRSS
jgi:hypothetical protein